MNIIETQTPDHEQKDTIFRLWNNEYPQQLGYTDIAGLDNYLGNLQCQSHYFAIDGQSAICGWAFTFIREQEKWFAIIVDSAFHKKGIGSLLLQALKDKEPILNGWVTDHYRYTKQNGQPYLSPLPFYIKNGFTVCANVRLEAPVLSAVKISWRAQ
jgi:GNAT superfamily N-acetyltransferase